MYNKRVERRADCESTEVSSLRVYVSERASRSGREEWERQGSGRDIGHILYNVRAMHREARGATPLLVSIVSRRLVVVQCTCVATNETIKLQNTQSEIRRRRSHVGGARGFRIRPNPEFTKLSMDFQSAIASATSRATSESHPVYARSPRGCDLAAEVTLTGRANSRNRRLFALSSFVWHHRYILHVSRRAQKSEITDHR